MEKIIISGEIGFDVLPFQIREDFNSLGGQDAEVVFNTPGGIVFAGIEINSIISDYKRENPSAQMIAHIIQAASMGSFISSNPAFDLRTVEPASGAMVHNPRNGLISDYVGMRKNADFLDRFAGVMAIDYARILKKTIPETRAIMDQEVWYVGGQALIDAGLADEMISSDSAETKESAFAKAELGYKTVMAKVRNHEETENEFKQMAAMVKAPQSNTPASSGKNIQGEIIVKNIDELEEKFPELYAEMKKSCTEAGIIQEKTERTERVKILLAMKGRKDFEGIKEIADRIDEGILEDETVSSVELGIMALFKKDSILAALDTAAIGDIKAPDAGTASGEVNLVDDEDGF